MTGPDKQTGAEAGDAEVRILPGSGESVQPHQPGCDTPAAAGRDAHRRPLPRWVAVIFLAACLGLIPQILSLSSSLSEMQLVSNWRATWVGLDVAESVAFLFTAWLLYRRSPLVSVTASIAFAMLWLDAWFDVMTAVDPDAIATARTLAVFAELPLGLFCLWVALRPLGVLHRPRWVRRRRREG